MLVGIYKEFEHSDLGDVRLNKRVVSLAESLESRHGGAISYTCGDWKNSKAAYRFLSNPRFSEQKMVEPHIEQTSKRVRRSAKEEKVLVVHDTTSFSFTHHRDTEGLGYTTGHLAKDTDELCFAKGFLLHASLALTDSGIPLGLLYSKQWTRNIKDLHKVRKSGKNHTRIPIKQKESYKWIEGIEKACQKCDGDNLIHVCDRDGDVYEVFETCKSLQTSFVVRAIHSRGTAISGQKSFSKLSKTTERSSEGDLL